MTKPRNALLESRSYADIFAAVYLGSWREVTPTPEDFNAVSKHLGIVSKAKGADMDVFVGFLKTLLVWLPEDRLSVYLLIIHGWTSKDRGA